VDLPARRLGVDSSPGLVFERCLEHLRAGATLVAWRLDRLGHSRGTREAVKMRQVIELPARLTDGQVTLRPIRTDDAAPYAAAFREDPDLGRLLGIETDPDEASARDRIEGQAQCAADSKFVQFAISDAATDAFWGMVLVHSLHEQHRRGEVGFWVVPGQRRRGVGSRAVALTVSWLFGELDLLRVEMTTTPDNQVVRSLARRLGFKQEGVLRSRNIERRQRVDLVWFGLLREEWHGT
jgi:[ribosomal protein S5]-alanine N-acetyltransferase